MSEETSFFARALLRALQMLALGLSALIVANMLLEDAVAIPPQQCHTRGSYCLDVEGIDGSATD